MDFVSDQLTKANRETKENSNNTAATDKHVVFREAHANMRKDDIPIVDELTRIVWKVQQLMDKLSEQNKRRFFLQKRSSVCW